MNCPHCASGTTKEQAKKTSLGYRTFRCSACKQTFNERTETPFNFLEYPPDIVLLVVLWRLRYKLSPARIWLNCFWSAAGSLPMRRGGAWEVRFAPVITKQLRIKRRGKAGQSWYVDETYVKVRGKWCYLYRAIDADGNLVDSRLSEKRDMEAAQQFFKQALAVVDHAPERVTTDGHASYPRAVRAHTGRSGMSPNQHIPQ